MKTQIRRNVFETNSSSVHSLTICTDSLYDKWKNGEAYIHNKEIVTRDKAIETLKTSKSWRNSNCLRYPDVDWTNDIEVDDVLSDESYKTYTEYFDKLEYDTYETYEESYITENGEKIIAFGYYGEDR